MVVQGSRTVTQPAAGRLCQDRPVSLSGYTEVRIQYARLTHFSHANGLTPGLLTHPAQVIHLIADRHPGELVEDNAFVHVGATDLVADGL